MKTLTRKNVKFESSDTCEKSIQELKEHFVTTLLLTIQNGVEEFIIYKNASS